MNDSETQKPKLLNFWPAAGAAHTRGHILTYSMLEKKYTPGCPGFPEDGDTNFCIRETLKISAIKI